MESLVDFALQERPGETMQNPEKQRRYLDKKGKKSYFGFKLHTKEDFDFGLIRSLQTTTEFMIARFDLSEKGEVVYRDRGYFGAEPKGFNATTQRGVRGHPIGIRDILRNKRISRKHLPVRALCRDQECFS